MKRILLILLLTTVAAGAAESVPAMPPPVETRELVSLVARDGGFDAYWILANWATRDVRFLRTSFGANGVQQGSTEAIDAGPYFGPYFESVRELFPVAVAGQWQNPVAVAPDRLFLISGSHVEERWQEPYAGSIETVGCGASRCLAISRLWSSGLAIGTATDLNGVPVGPSFAIPAFAALHSLVVNERGALLIRLVGGELHATFIDFEGHLLFDQPLVRGLLHQPSASADDDGQRFVVAWLDSAAVFGPAFPYGPGFFSIEGSNVVRLASITYEGNVTELPSVRADAENGCISAVALAWNGESHMLAAPEYAKMGAAEGAIAVWQIDGDLRALRRAGAIGIPGYASLNGLDVIGVANGFALTWSTLVVRVSSSGEISTPAPLVPSAIRLRTAR